MWIATDQIIFNRLLKWYDYCEINFEQNAVPTLVLAKIIVAFLLLFGCDPVLHNGFYEFADLQLCSHITFNNWLLGENWLDGFVWFVFRLSRKIYKKMASKWHGSIGMDSIFLADTIASFQRVSEKWNMFAVHFDHFIDDMQTYQSKSL